MAKAPTSLKIPGVRATMFSDKGLRYPYQSNQDDVSDTLAGEYRGYYPTNQWKPSSSKYLGRKGGTAHNGVDIYAGFAPFPRETPIYAVTGGKFFHMTDDDRPDDSGHRAAIETKVGKDTVHFRYGHLSRFHGTARTVKAGALIGFAGCSGNADTEGECSSAANQCNLTSCHVHLITAINSFGNKMNPPDLLGWKLGYADVTASTQCNAWPGKPAETPANPRGTGPLRREKPKELRRLNNRRRPPPKPFQYVDFDDTRRLNRAIAAYDNLASRLSSEITKDETKFGPFLATRMQHRWSGAPAGIATLMGELAHEIAALEASDDQAWLGGHVARALMQLRKGAWLLTGGQAIRTGMSNRTIEDLIDAKWPSDLKKHHWISNPDIGNEYAILPECGASIGGLAHMVASDNSVAVHHRTTLTVGDVQHTVTSMDFAMGSQMHGIWSPRLAEGLGAPEVEQAKAESFMRDVDIALSAIWQAAMSAHRHTQPLSLKNDVSGSELDARRQAAAELVLDLKLARFFLVDAAGFLDVSALSEAQQVARATLIGGLVRELARLNDELYTAARDASRTKEGAVPIGPRLMLLEVEPNPPRPEEE